MITLQPIRPEITAIGGIRIRKIFLPSNLNSESKRMYNPGNKNPTLGEVKNASRKKLEVRNILRQLISFLFTKNRRINKDIKNTLVTVDLLWPDFIQVLLELFQKDIELHEKNFQA